VPRGESIAYPASHCPQCDHPIRRRDNVPILSWILLRGRCRDCSARISARYPLVEAATAVLFGLAAARLVFSGIVPEPRDVSAIVAGAALLIAFLYLAAISVALTAIDIDTHRLPNVIVYPAYLVGAVLLTVAALATGRWDALLTAGIGAVALFGFYLLLALVYPGGMGFGDVKLAGVLGLFLGWLGWGPLAIGAFAAFALGGVFSVIVVALRRGGRKTRIPFGPWMVAGAWVGILAGAELSAWYLGLFGLA